MGRIRIENEGISDAVAIAQSVLGARVLAGPTEETVVTSRLATQAELFEIDEKDRRRRR